MRIILTEIELQTQLLPSDVQFINITIRDLNKYDCNKDVIAIIGSRAMAIKVSKMYFPSLRLFQLTSAGFDGVPIEEFGKKGIAVANAGAVYSVPIAETVILGLLLMAKRLHPNPNNRHIRITRHYDLTINELMGKRILLMGTGNIGAAITQRLYGFDVVIDGYNKTALNKHQYARVLSGRKELLDHIGEYDYIICSLPDTEETRGFINKELLEAMSSKAIIINVGRHSVFNEDDLFHALKHGSINGAVLDMFEKVPNPLTNKFRRLSNVIVLPGVSAISKEVNDRLRNHVINNVLSLLNEGPINSVINQN